MTLAELLILSAIVAALLWLFGPMRRRITHWVAKKFRPTHSGARIIDADFRIVHPPKDDKDSH